MPSGDARPPWSLHLSPALLYFLAPATSCDHGPRPCVSVFTVTFLLLRCQLHGTSSLLSTAVCFAPGIQQELNTCYLSTPEGRLVRHYSYAMHKETEVQRTLSSGHHSEAVTEPVLCPQVQAPASQSGFQLPGARGVHPLAHLNVLPPL